MEEPKSLPEMLESIQLEKNHAIGDYSGKTETWYNLVKKATSDMVDKMHDEIVARLAKKREKYRKYNI